MKRQPMWIEFDNLRRLFYIKYEMRRQLLKTAMNTGRINNLHRLHSKYLFARIPRMARLTQTHARCLILGRARGVNTRYGLSRFAFRLAANHGLVTRIRRGSW